MNAVGIIGIDTDGNLVQVVVGTLVIVERVVVFTSVNNLDGKGE